MLKKGFAVILVLLLAVGCILPAGAVSGGAFDECVQMLNEYINGGCAEPYMTDPDDGYSQIRKIDYMSNVFMSAWEYDARGFYFFCDAIKYVEDEMFTIASEPLALLMTERNLNEYLSLWSDPEADVVMLLLDYSNGRRLEFEGDETGALEAYRLCQGFMDADARLAALGGTQDSAEELPEIMPVWDRLYARVSAVNANLYAMPSENSSVVGVVWQGSAYLLTGFGGEWICIENEMNGAVGYGRIQDFEIIQNAAPTAAPSQRPVITPIPTPVPTPVPTPTPTPTPVPAQSISHYLRYNDLGIWASSYRTNNSPKVNPEKMLDGDPLSSWDSHDERYASFGVYTKDGREYAVQGVRIINGKNSDGYYEKNCRVRTMDLYVDGVYRGSISLEDRRGTRQVIYFSETLVGSSFDFRITQVYSGTKYNDVVISELELF